MKAPLRLTEQELAFFRLTLNLFPAPESPLRYLHDEDHEPEDPEAIFAQLSDRELLNENSSGASDDVRARLDPVSECDARVLLRLGSTGSAGMRNFYIAKACGVEYDSEIGVHIFGVPCSENDLAAELAAEFTTTEEIRARPLSMSAGDYLVFAVFARDLRSKPEAEESDDGADAPMSIDEVLSYFDEPETEYVRTPSDESWQRSVDGLCKDGVLVATKSGDGYQLHPSLHAVAREIVADRQHTVVRFDFLDEHWLVREVSLYPTRETVYRLGTQADGSVVIEELSTGALMTVLEQVVTTLPNILSPDMPPMLRGAALHARGVI